MLQSNLLTHTGVAHGFLTRSGGVSEGIYQSLNCGPGSDDNPAHVAENRRAAMKRLTLEAAPLVTVHQIHSSDVVFIDENTDLGARPKADAMVTRRTDTGLGILTADCLPVLFADPHNRVIGAAHSGWRGAVGGICEATIAAMIAHGAEKSRIHAAIGPAIQQQSYEVGPEFPAPFLDLDPVNRDFFIPSKRKGHYMFDLSGFVLRRLEEQSIAAIDNLGNDTFVEEDRFFSYRRMSKRGERDYGRQISIIALLS